MTQTALKIIALLCMVLDHIADYFPSAPDWFSLVGRISAPLFIFCLIEGFYKTKDRKKMMKRLYFFSVLMAGLNIAIVFLADNPGFEIHNNIFQTLFATLFFIYLLSVSKKKAWIYIGISFIIAVFMLVLGEISVNMRTFSGLLAALLGNPFLTEGGFATIILGYLLYRCYPEKRKLLLAWVLYWGILFLCENFHVFYHLAANTVGRIFDVDGFLYIGEALLGVRSFPVSYGVIDFNRLIPLCALPLMCLYNGDRGRGMKYFFYIFYPAHIYILIAISGEWLK